LPCERASLAKPIREDAESKPCCASDGLIADASITRTARARRTEQIPAALISRKYASKMRQSPELNYYNTQTGRFSAEN